MYLFKYKVILYFASFPGLDACFHIYKQILTQHLMNPLNKFNITVQRYADNLVNAALALHNKLASTFLPTAIKFHYIFNLRDLSNIFQVSKNILFIYVKYYVIFPFMPIQHLKRSISLTINKHKKVLHVYFF